MYSTEVIKSYIERAKQIIIEKNKKYNKLIRTIETFIVNNNIIVKPDNRSLYPLYNLYTNNIYVLPKELTNLLYKTDVLAKDIVLIVKINKYYSKISFNNITFITFTYINEEISNSLLDYKCAGIYKKYKCFGPEIELINIYAELVNPKYIDSWSELLISEHTLLPNISNKLVERISGGKMDNNDDVINLLLSKFINTSHVIIGQYANNFYNKTNKPVVKLQIITMNHFNDEVSNLKVILPSINYKIYHLKIPTNLKLYKMSISYNKNIVMEIYNAGQIEVISYIPGPSFNIQIGTPFVLKRFKLIDIWNITYLLNIGAISKEVSINIISKLVREFNDIKNVTDLSILFSKNYIGYIEDEFLSQARLANKLKLEFIPPYSPAKKI
jgi:hypothetical protein